MADSLEERKQAVANAMGASPQNTVDNGGETGSDTDYYTQLKNESYRAMLDSEIQADVAKSEAQKYVGNSLKANGFGGQGMAESSRLGIMNVYGKALSDAQEVNNQNQIDIANQEIAAKEQDTKDNFESLTTLMANATDNDTLTKILGNYKISVDENGVMSGEGYDALDANSKNQLASLYSLYSSQYTDVNGVYTDIARLQNATIIGSNGKPLNLGTQFNEEIQIAFAKANQGSLEAGDVVCLDNTNKKSGGTKGYIMWTGKGFKIVSESDYNSAKAKGKSHTSKWISGSESKWYDE